MRKEQLEYAAARYGTPLYIFDLDMLTQQTRRLQKAFGREIGLCYAMKANPFLTAHMAEEVDRIEAEKAAAELEASRIADLKEKCAKKGLNFEEEAKYQAKQAKKKKK